MIDFMEGFLEVYDNRDRFDEAEKCFIPDVKKEGIQEYLNEVVSKAREADDDEWENFTEDMYDFLQTLYELEDIAADGYDEEDED